jgi:hypothetical protein
MKKIVNRVKQFGTLVKEAATKFDNYVSGRIEKIKSDYKLRKKKRRELRRQKMPTPLFGFLKSISKEYFGIIQKYRKFRSVHNDLYILLNPFGIIPTFGRYGNIVSVHHWEHKDFDVVVYCKKVKDILVGAGWSIEKPGYVFTSGSYDAVFTKNGMTIFVYVYLSEKCDIEEYEDTVTKQRVVGLCAAAIESINN